MCSNLFVPGSRPEPFGKALASAADAISIDLEDAVVESRKPEARDAVADLLRSDVPRAATKSIIVDVFRPDEAEVQQAHRLLEAARHAEANGAVTSQGFEGRIARRSAYACKSARGTLA